MNNPIAAGCSEMVSDDIAMDGELITIDCHIRCEICPSRLPTEAALAHAWYIEAALNLNKRQSNYAVKLKSFRI
jgi:hypothetical protein